MKTVRWHATRQFRLVENFCCAAQDKWNVAIHSSISVAEKGVNTTLAYRCTDVLAVAVVAHMSNIFPQTCKGFAEAADRVWMSVIAFLYVWTQLLRL